MTEHYRQGALSVRWVHGFPGGFAVYFDHGAEQRPEAIIATQLAKAGGRRG